MPYQEHGVVQFYDDQPLVDDFYSEVIEGLKQSPRKIPPKFFYDTKGSRLFDAICELPEYYQTRTEISLLTQYAQEIAALIGEQCLLIEPGSGSCEKVRYLLDEIQPAAYMPMDISRVHLFDAVEQLSNEYPWLDIHASCMDFTANVKLHFCPPNIHKVAFFPGSSIGNFEPDDAVVFMRHIAQVVGKGGGLLIGVDLKKDEKLLRAAYNDSQDVTAEFNLNLLHRINDELNADFDLEHFKHNALYNDKVGRIEMHLVSTVEQTVTIGEQEFRFRESETIHTENSYKYTVAEFEALARQAGYEQKKVWLDSSDLFSLHYYEVKN
ncbi:hypothetical protein MNBD_GAMMA24-1763 [hydrothermal vent metagenome]|uniref:Histidine-specific methyltransferase SAM-dependent domain-containing protein n=1 Tax=hydrothermal vent metagenome TaxID=652676 RepID=A0A3B1BKW1_9ZZZZ